MSELQYFTIGMIFDILEEHQIDNMEQGNKNFYYVNEMDLQTGLNAFLPVS